MHLNRKASSGKPIEVQTSLSARLGAKRGKRRKSMRPRTKTPSLVPTNAAERPRAVRCQTHPAEGCQGFMGTGSDQPPYFGHNLTLAVKFVPHVSFLFWTVHGPFSLFSTRGEKRKWGVQPKDTPAPACRRPAPVGRIPLGIQISRPRQGTKRRHSLCQATASEESTKKFKEN